MRSEHRKVVCLDHDTAATHESELKERTVVVVVMVSSCYGTTPYAGHMSLMKGDRKCAPMC